MAFGRFSADQSQAASSPLASLNRESINSLLYGSPDVNISGNAQVQLGDRYHNHFSTNNVNFNIGGVVSLAVQGIRSIQLLQTAYWQCSEEAVQEFVHDLSRSSNLLQDVQSLCVKIQAREHRVGSMRTATLRLQVEDCVKDLQQWSTIATRLDSISSRKPRPLVVRNANASTFQKFQQMTKLICQTRSMSHLLDAQKYIRQRFQEHQHGLTLALNFLQTEFQMQSMDSLDEIIQQNKTISRSVGSAVHSDSADSNRSSIALSDLQSMSTQLSDRMDNFLPMAEQLSGQMSEIMTLLSQPGYRLPGRAPLNPHIDGLRGHWNVSTQNQYTTNRLLSPKPYFSGENVDEARVDSGSVDDLGEGVNDLLWHLKSSSAKSQQTAIQPLSNIHLDNQGYDAHNIVVHEAENFDDEDDEEVSPFDTIVSITEDLYHLVEVSFDATLIQYFIALSKWRAADLHDRILTGVAGSDNTREATTVLNHNCSEPRTILYAIQVSALRRQLQATMLQSDLAQLDQMLRIELSDIDEWEKATIKFESEQKLHVHETEIPQKGDKMIRMNEWMFFVMQDCPHLANLHRSMAQRQAQQRFTPSDWSRLTLKYWLIDEAIEEDKQAKSTVYEGDNTVVMSLGEESGTTVKVVDSKFELHSLRAEENFPPDDELPETDSSIDITDAELNGPVLLKQPTINVNIPMPSKYTVSAVNEPSDGVPDTKIRIAGKILEKYREPIPTMQSSVMYPNYAANGETMQSTDNEPTMPQPLFSSAGRRHHS